MRAAVMRVACIVSTLLATLSIAPERAHATPPTGNVDGASQSVITGWTSDADTSGAIAVHIYIDGHIAHAMLADHFRADVGAHGFSWVPPLLGPGTHRVNVYAIDVAPGGAPTGMNADLPGSPRNVTGSCTGFAMPSARAWCDGVPAYYRNRGADTDYLFNDAVRIGVNHSYGGTIFELYGADHTDNLVLEHGGGAMQLSLWGYDPVGAPAWFAAGTTSGGAYVCDTRTYASEAECRAGTGAARCMIFAYSGGSHVADCASVRACNEWGAGSPYNALQAEGINCLWDTPTNDADAHGATGSTITVRVADPAQFTKSNLFPGLVFDETVTLLEAGARVEYTIRYPGSRVLGPTTQELPAIFPAAGLHYSYDFYDGPAPYTGAPVTTITATGGTESDVLGAFLQIEGHGPYPHAVYPSTHVLTEHWVSACDTTGTRCVTLATFSPQVREISTAAYPGNGEGYLTPIGNFALAPGLDETVVVYVFPYRHDQMVAGRTVREWIRSYFTCPAGLTACEGRCVDTTSSAAHCGGCGRACPGTACRASTCDPAAIDAWSSDVDAAVVPGEDAASDLDAAGLDAAGLDAAGLDASVVPGADASSDARDLDAAARASGDAGRRGIAGGCSCHVTRVAPSAAPWLLPVALAIASRARRRRAVRSGR